MNKQSQGGSIQLSRGRNKWSGPIGRDMLLMKIIIVLVGISISLVYSVEGGRAQRSESLKSEL